MKFQLYKDQSGQWRWRLLAQNGKIVATSGESYINKSDCLHGIDLVKSTTSTTEVEEV